MPACWFGFGFAGGTQTGPTILEKYDWCVHYDEGNIIGLFEIKYKVINQMSKLFPISVAAFHIL
jgi:hypothetical protein